MRLTTDARALVAELLRVRGRRLIADPRLELAMATEAHNEYNETEHELRQRVALLVERGRQDPAIASELFDEILTIIITRIARVEHDVYASNLERAMTSHSAATAAWTHGEATVNGVRLHYVEAGSGPLVLLLHGFPEFWYSWRHQIPALAAAGYHVVAPDMRGYNTSAKPRGVRSYALESLAGDVLGLIRYFGAERATVAGHDWGGAVAWYVPMYYPQAVEKLIVLNAPHPAAYMRELRTPDQLRRSWYVLFFQLPALPEAAFRAHGYAMLERTLRAEPTRPDAFTDDDIRRYKRALSQPGALTAAINYYRALFRRDPRAARSDLRPITCPTLLIWGEHDRYLSPRLTEGLDGWVPTLRVERIPTASHWVQVDAPDRVNELVLDFLRRP